MKDFDRVELGAVRKMTEAEHWFDRRKGIACRQEVHESFVERVKAAFNRVVLKEGRL